MKYELMKKACTEQSNETRKRQRAIGVHKC